MWTRITPADYRFENVESLLYSYGDNESMAVIPQSNHFEFLLKSRNFEKTQNILIFLNISKFTISKSKNFITLSIPKNERNKIASFLTHLQTTYQFSLEMYLHFALATNTFREMLEITEASLQEIDDKLNSLFPAIPTDFQILIAKAFILNGEYENAINKLIKIKKEDDVNLYQQAQYLLGQIIYSHTDSSEYPTVRHHSRQAFIHFNEAGNYQDAAQLRAILYEILCLGNDKLKSKHIVDEMPTGDIVALLKIADAFYQNVQEKETLLQQQEAGIATKKLKQAKKQVEKEGFFRWKSFDKKEDNKQNPPKPHPRKK